MDMNVRGFTVLIDERDMRVLSGFNWGIQTRSGISYAIAGKNGKCVLMHRLIMRAPVGSMIDHINGNGLDNRRENLRFCTHAQNMANRKTHINNKTGHPGVIANSGRGKPWRVRLQLNGVKLSLGQFETKEEAIAARIDAEIKFFREFRSSH